VRWRRRNGWAVLAETCERTDTTPLQAMIAMGLNVLVTNTAFTGKVLVIDKKALDLIPRMQLPAEDASEFGVRVPYDFRMYR
jgi:hypothetical protein